MDFVNYIKEEALVLIPVLMILGKMIKTSKLIPNRFIPLSLLAISIVFTTSLLGMSYHSIVQAILIAGAAVFGHQLVKQAKNGD